MKPSPPSPWTLPRSATLAALTVGVGLALPVPASAQTLTGNATARYGSGNTIHGQSSASGYALGQAGSTPPTSIATSLFDGSGSAQSDLSIGALAVRGYSEGVSNTPTDNRNFFVNGLASISYNDTLTVYSDTLAAGTPVTLNFSIQVVTSRFATHDVGTTKGTSQTQNYAYQLLGIGLGASDTLGVGSYYMDANDHKTYYDTRTGTTTSFGIFTGGTGHVDFAVNSVVGHTVSFGLTLSTSTSVNVGPAPVGTFGTLVNHGGTSDAQLGVAFGATASSPEVIIKSAYKSGGAFPASSLATPANAAAMVPELDSTVGLSALGLAGFAAWRHRRSRSSSDSGSPRSTGRVG